MKNTQSNLSALFTLWLTVGAVTSGLLFGVSVAQAENVTQSSDDVQMLQASTDRFFTLDNYGTQTEGCVGANPTEGQNVTKDCFNAALPFIQVSWSTQISPSIASWSLPFYNYQGRIGSRYASGNLVELRALVKKSVLNASSFEGIGFYRRNLLEDGITFVPKEQLHVVSDPNAKLRLKSSGDEAVVLRFVMYFPGEQGNSATGWCMQSVEFKPFAQFKSGDTTFQNWEKLARNHRVFRCNNAAGLNQTSSFDRSNELVQ